MALWNQDVEDQLVTMIQERPPLYDITEKLYANRVVKTELWREIEEKLVISGKFFFLAIEVVSKNCSLLFTSHEQLYCANLFNPYCSNQKSKNYLLAPVLGVMHYLILPSRFVRNPSLVGQNYPKP